MRKKRILIVDDESTMQVLLKNILEKEGYETFVAANGVDALNILKGEYIDLIILDILMPIMDGFGFFKELKASPVTEQIPVLVLTIRKKMEDSFMALGADSFLGKPIDREKLLLEIKLILEHETHDSEEMIFKDVRQEELSDENSVELSQEESGSASTRAPTGQPASEQAKLVKGVTKNILVAGTIDSIVRFMANKLKAQGCNIEVATTAEEVLNKTLRWKPDILLLEIDMSGISSTEIIKAIKQNSVVHTQILLYSCFMSKESEAQSIVHTYYSHQFEKSPHEEGHENQPVYYFGAFHRHTFINRIKKFLSFSF